MTLTVALLGVALAWLAFGRPAYLSNPQRTKDGQRPLDRRVVADVSIIIPARNEERTLPTLLASIDSSTVLPAEVIVVDDSSTDATSLVARRHGAVVIGAPPLPDGWLGKPWACHLGAQRARTARLLFLDADVCLAPDALETLLARKATQGAGLLSVQPQHRPLRVYEQLSVMFNVVGPMGCGAFSLRQARPLRTAFGPCMLADAADYDRVGGHEAVRGEVVEDLALAGRFADGGQEVHLLLGGDRISFRMYPDGLRTLLDGWTKNIAAGATRTNPVSSLITVLWVAALCSTTSSAVLGVMAWVQGDGTPWTALVAWFVAVLQVFVLMRRVGRFHPLTAVLFPIPLAVFVAVFTRSALRLLLNRPVRWRGRDVPSRPTRAEQP